MGTLVEKGRHDDELIDALMVQLPRGPHPNQRPVTQSQPPESSCTPTCHPHDPGARCSAGPSPKAWRWAQEQHRGCQRASRGPAVRG